MKGIFRHESEVTMSVKGPFPAKILLSKEDTPMVSVKVGRLPVGGEIVLHSHEGSNQLEYYPEGRAT